MSNTRQMYLYAIAVFGFGVSAFSHHEDGPGSQLFSLAIFGFIAFVFGTNAGRAQTANSAPEPSVRQRKIRLVLVLTALFGLTLGGPVLDALNNSRHNRDLTRLTQTLMREYPKLKGYSVLYDTPPHRSSTSLVSIVKTGSFSNRSYCALHVTDSWDIALLQCGPTFDLTPPPIPGVPAPTLLRTPEPSS